MDKNKMGFIAYILIFCTTITGICFFYLGNNFGFTHVEPGKNDINREEIANNEKIVNDELIKLFDNLTMKSTSNASCKRFTTNYLSEFTTSGYNYNFLNDLAPLAMECMYGLVFENNKMTKKDYEELNKYFNVTLESDIDNKEMYIAYNRGSSGVNKYNYSIGDIIKTGNDYKAVVKVYESAYLVSKGTIIVAVNDGHIYYKSFVLNEH